MFEALSFHIKAGLLGLGAFLLCFGFASYQVKSKEVNALQERVIRVTEAQKYNQETIKALRQENEHLLSSLQEWKGKYASIDEANKDSKQKIYILEKENEELRAFLNLAIPDDAWHILFPEKAK